MSHERFANVAKLERFAFVGSQHVATHFLLLGDLGVLAVNHLFQIFDLILLWQLIIVLVSQLDDSVAHLIALMATTVAIRDQTLSPCRVTMRIKSDAGIANAKNPAHLNQNYDVSAVLCYKQGK